MRGLRRRLALIAALLLALASCGISGEHSARAIPRPALPSPGRHATSEGPGAVDEILYLVQDGRLVPVRRQVSDIPTLDSASADLLAGPTSAERRAGYTSALLGTDPIAAISRHGSQAVVGLAADGDDQVRNDQVLGFAQIVCTLTRLADVSSVSFRYDGQSVAVPRADGSLSEGPLTAADYQSLLAAG